MSDPDPFPTPRRREARADNPPEHADRPRPQLPYSLEEARAAARGRLSLWLAQHGERPPS